MESIDTSARIQPVCESGQEFMRNHRFKGVLLARAAYTGAF
jgi:hypothetical protein